MATTSDLSIVHRMPAELQAHWQEFAIDCIRNSQAPIALVPGATAAAFYANHLKGSHIEHDVLWLHGVRRYSHELPCGWVEWEDPSRYDIKRIAFGVYHPEGFNRHRGTNFTDVQRNLAFRERLIDQAMIFLFGQPHLSAFLSTSPYFWQVSTGIVSLILNFQNEIKKVVHLI